MKLNWAERWAVNNPFRVLQQRIEIRLLKGMVTLPSGARVLEVGCGRGAGAGLILKKFQPALLHASDLDWEMIRKARNFLSLEQRGKIILYVGDVLRLPYRDNAMDAVFVFGVLHHVLDWRSGLAEIARVLKTGGLFFFEELYPSLYQNVITKHILLHPRHDRFFGNDLKAALKEVNLPLKNALEFKKLGILGVSIKES
ncbi:MAG: class I SAM-dependent methyltransferase [Pseudomonadota bacterium]